MFMPYCIPYIFPGLKSLVSPKMVRHIELPSVGEEPSPPYHPVWSKWHEPSNCPIETGFLVGAGRIWVHICSIRTVGWAHSRNWTPPAADSWEKPVASCLTELQKFLIFFEFIHHLHEGWIASFITLTLTLRWTVWSCSPYHVFQVPTKVQG